jgi:Ca2+-binding RTX toxin-like protein
MVKRLVVAVAVVTFGTSAGAGVAYAMTIDCNGGDCTGTNRADTMNGSPQDDKMLALEGGDILYGVGGMDALRGKGGGDGIFGGEGNDTVRGGTHSAANDHARDVLICGPGRDKVFFVRGQDVLRGCEIERPSN